MYTHIQCFYTIGQLYCKCVSVLCKLCAWPGCVYLDVCLCVCVHGWGSGGAVCVNATGMYAESKESLPKNT